MHIGVGFREDVKGCLPRTGRPHCSLGYIAVGKWLSATCAERNAEEVIADLLKKTLNAWLSLVAKPSETLTFKYIQEKPIRLYLHTKSQ